MGRSSVNWNDIAVNGDMTTGHSGYPPQSVRGTGAIFTIRGVPVVLVGDTHTAPHCNNGCHTGTVVDGVSSCTVRGTQVSYHGAGLSCGDTIA